MPRARKTCKQCGIRPVRQRRGASLCTPCVSRMAKKTCSVCEGVFQADMLVGTRCRPCLSARAHAKRIQETYSITADQYAALLEAQGGACYICRRKPVSKRLATDHDHACCPGPISCGRCVRGLLCRNCNRDVLGHLKDDVDALQRAIDYLTSPPAHRVLVAPGG